MVEFGVAIVAGVIAASPALVGFSLDSLIELAAGFVIVWLYRLRSGHADERRAQQLLAGTYVMLVLFIVVESIASLTGGRHPEVSWVGIGLAAVTALTMPLLARAKRRVGHKLGSSATVSESAQNQICAYLSIALLAGPRERARGLVVGRPGCCARNRHPGGEGRPRQLARHELRLLLNESDDRPAVSRHSP